jgi:steroid 5-alpha reductase family enzyme
MMPTLWVFGGLLPVWPAVAVGTRPLHWLDALATGVAAGAIWLEARADKELLEFRSSNRKPGEILATGVWSWSRHPNYFFEWLHWFTYVFLAVGSHLFPLSLFGPVVMLVFLYRVSGIPWTEAQALRSRGEDYRRYQQEVSAFIPWPPKRG